MFNMIEYDMTIDYRMESIKQSLRSVIDAISESSYKIEEYQKICNAMQCNCTKTEYVAKIKELQFEVLELVEEVGSLRLLMSGELNK